MADPDGGKFARVRLPSAPSSRWDWVMSPKGGPVLHVDCAPVFRRDSGIGAGAPAWKREIRLHDDDLIAAAQILAWIAMPHRPQPGVHLLEQWYWARRRYRKEELPNLPFALRKRNRLELQLAQFHRRVLDGIRAGQWFNRRVLTSTPVAGPVTDTLRSLGASTRQLAKLYANANGIEQGNAIRAIWSKRKPVVHLALAAGDVLGRLHFEENRHGFDLARCVFSPDWVTETIDHAARRVDGAIRFGGFVPPDFYWFHRDNN